MYDSYFGLTGLPFQLTPDPRFLFHGKGHREAFAALQESLASGARVLVVTGEVGAGKTTLVQALLASVDPASTATAQISASSLDAETLSDRLCDVLGQPYLPDALARRDALLARLRSGPLPTLLVIDEAQHLGPSAFELLETIGEGAAATAIGLQICLIGQPELRILLNAPERSRFRALIGVDRHLGPLEQTEVRLYIEHRLHRAGWTGRPEFDDAAFFEIFVFTAGIPRRVNLLCNSLLLSAWLSRQRRIDAPGVTQAAAAMRGDSFLGAPDLLEGDPPVAGPPTLTDAFEPEAPELAASARSDEASLRPSPGPGDSASAAGSDSTPVIPASFATGAQDADDRPALTMSDGTPQVVDPRRGGPINARLAGLMARAGSAARGRRQAIVACAASVAVVVVVIAYVVDQQTVQADPSRIEVRDVVAKRSPPGEPPAPAIAPTPTPPAAIARATASAVPTARLPSPELSRPTADLDARRTGATEGSDGAPGNAAGKPPQTVPATPESAAPGRPAAELPAPRSCSGPAFVLGLCDPETSTSTRRK